MKTVINNNNLNALIKGASIFTTGGGVSIDDQFESLKNIAINVTILSLEEFEKDSYLCTVGELGPTDVPPLKKEKVVVKMLEKLKMATNKKIVGLFPPEVGQESVVIECANLLNLPIADFDPTGFRAVPYFDMNIFNVKKIDFNLTPIVVATDKDEIMVIENEKSYKKVEKRLRSMTSLSDSGLIFLMGMTVSVETLIKNKLNNPSFTKALRFGEIKSIKKLIKKLSPKKIIEGRIVEKSEFEVKGFLAEKVVVKDKAWNLFTLIILNEVLFVIDSEEQIIASVPDRILLIDPNEPKGISSAALTINKSIIIAVIEPENAWKSKSAQKILGKARFSKLL